MASELHMSGNQIYHIHNCFPGVLHSGWHKVERITFLIKSLAFRALILSILFLLLLNVENQSELISLVTWDLVK